MQAARATATAVVTAGELGNGGAIGGYQSLDENVSDMVGVTKATHIAMGGQFACAIVESGAAWCWGSNAAGQLGAKVDHPPPVAPP